MSVHEKIAEDAAKVASLTSVKRVRVEDAERSVHATNGGERRLADRLRKIRFRLEKSLS